MTSISNCKANLTPTQILKDAKELISDPVSWIKDDFHILKSAETIGLQKDVHCYCMVGAIQQASGYDYTSLTNDGYLYDDDTDSLDHPMGQVKNLGNAMSMNRAKAYLRRAVVRKTGALNIAVPAFNDDFKTTHKDVLDVFDEAIRLSEVNPFIDDEE